MKFRSIAPLFMLATGLSTLAGSGPYFNTYTHNLEAKEWELEVGADAVKPDEGTWQYGQALELEHGFNEHFNAGVYLLGSKIPGEPWKVDGYKLESRYRPWTQNFFFVPTFYLEYEQFHHPEVYRNAVAGNVEEEEKGGTFRTEHEVEARLIFSQDFGWGNLALNLVAERSLDGGKTAFGYSGGVFFLGPSSGKAGSTTFDPDNDGDSHFLYGVELYGGLGEEGILGLRRGQQEHYVQPFAAFPLGERLTLKTGVAVGLTSLSETRLRAVLVVRLGRGR